MGGDPAPRLLRLLFSKRVNKPASEKRNNLPRETRAARMTTAFSKSLQLQELPSAVCTPQRGSRGTEGDRDPAECRSAVGGAEEEPRRSNEQREWEALLVLISRNAELALISGGQAPSPARTSGAPFVFQRGGRVSAAAHISQGHVWLFCTSQISASDDILSRGSLR